MNIQPIVFVVRQALRFAILLQDQFENSYNKSADTAKLDPVTLVDYGAQVIITRIIRAKFPNDTIVSEESFEQFQANVGVNQQVKLLDSINTFLYESLTIDDLEQSLSQSITESTNDRIWTIDPIDGTNGYINHRNFSVGVGLIEAGEASIGIIGVPSYRGGGVFYNQAGVLYRLPLDSDTVESIPIPETSKHLNIIVESYDDAPHASHKVMSDIITETGISQAMIVRVDGMEKYLQVAAGDADLYLRMPPLVGRSANKVWDHVPGVAIAKAVNCHIFDKDGNNLQFNRGEMMNNIGIIVSRGEFIHKIIENTAKIQYPSL